MPQNNPNPEPRPARRRRSTGEAVRVHVVKVRLSPAELQEMTEKAGRLGITIPRFLAESALAGEGQTFTEQRALLEAFLSARRLIGMIGNNVNQIAKVANATGHLQPHAPVVLEALGRVAARLQAAAEALEGR